MFTLRTATRCIRTAAAAPGPASSTAAALLGRLSPLSSTLSAARPHVMAFSTSTTPTSPSSSVSRSDSRSAVEASNAKIRMQKGRPSPRKQHKSLKGKPVAKRILEQVGWGVRFSVVVVYGVSHKQRHCCIFDVSAAHHSHTAPSPRVNTSSSHHTTHTHTHTHARTHTTFRWRRMWPSSRWVGGPLASSPSPSATVNQAVFTYGTSGERRRSTVRCVYCACLRCSVCSVRRAAEKHGTLCLLCMSTV